MVKVLILSGYGINCENETKYGFELTGVQADRVHINELISGQKHLKDYQIMALPGGFAFGDDLGAGKVLANKFRYNLGEQLQEFIRDGKLIIGICNGFQAMVRLGVLPGFDNKYDKEDVTLTFNASGRFENRWVHLKMNPNSNCIWAKGIDMIYLPVRHGEGKFLSKNEEIRKRLRAQNQIVAQYVDEAGNLADYPYCPNGAQDNIAAICDSTGRIFGIMPHPEAFLFPQNHPRWTREKVEKGEGLKILKNAVEFAERELS